MALRGELRLTIRSEQGRTRVAGAYCAGPLKVIRPFELPEGRVVLQVLHVGPGLLGGDELEVQVHVGPGAKAVLVSQSATKVLRTDRGDGARQRVVLTVQDGAELEYYPGLVIPFAGASYRQVLDVRLEGAARVGMLEVVALGRTARGEASAFRSLSSRLRVWHEGQLVFGDALELTPNLRDPRARGLLETHRYVGSGYWRWGDVPEAMVVRSDLLLACGRTGYGDVYVKGVAADGERLREAVRELVGGWRDWCGAAPSYGRLPVPHG